MKKIECYCANVKHVKISGSVVFSVDGDPRMVSYQAFPETGMIVLNGCEFLKGVDPETGSAYNAVKLFIWHTIEDKLGKPFDFSPSLYSYVDEWVRQ